MLAAGVAVAVVPAASGNQRGLDLPAVLSELGEHSGPAAQLCFLPDCHLAVLAVATRGFSGPRAVGGQVPRV